MNDPYKTPEVASDNKLILLGDKIVAGIGFVFMVLAIIGSSYFYFTTVEQQPEKEVGMVMVYGLIGFPSFLASFVLAITGLIRIVLPGPNAYSNFLFGALFIFAPFILQAVLTQYF